MKKFLSLVIAVVAMVVMSTSAFAAFSDMPSGEDGAVLQKAVDNGLIAGFEDGTIQPQTPITRAQMATIMSRAMNATDAADLSSFNDVKQGDWYYDAMAKAVFMEAFKGDDKSNLNPNNTISRQEAMIVLSRIFDMPLKNNSNVLSGFSDANAVASWALKEVCAVAAGGYLDGISSIRPLEPMTRLEFAQLMGKIVEQYIDEDGEYNALSGNVLIRAQNVKLSGIKGAKNIYTGDGVKGNVEFTDCDAKDVIIRGGKTVFNSGSYERIRAIGAGTEINLKAATDKLLKTLADGTVGSVYAKPGKGVIVVPTVNLELQ